MNINDFINFAHKLEQQKNAAFDLWSWLPSCEVARKHHGDYYSEHTPSIADVMQEASLLFAKMKNRPNEPLTEEEREWFARCPCGESHDESEKK